MRIFKLIIISIVFFFGLFTLISLLIPSQVRISKAINIGAPSEGIIPFLSDTSKWRSWHPASRGVAPDKAPSYLILPKQQNDSLVTMDFTTRKKETVHNGWQLYRYASTDSVTVQWYMDFKLRWYPWQKFGSLLYEATYGAMMQQGLQQLKIATESYKTDSTNSGH